MHHDRLIGIALALSALAGTAQSQVKLFTPSSAARIGVGYDTFSGEVFGNCVDAGSAVQTEGEKTYFEIIKIDNERDFSKRFSVSAKAKYAMFSAGGSSVSETTFNSYSTYMAVLARVNVRTQQADNPRLTAEARALAELNPKFFRQRCGNAFILSQTRGGEFAALVEVFNSTQTEREETKLAVEGSAKIFAASAEASKNINNVLKNRRYSAKLIRTGGVGPVASGADGILADALNFPVTLAKQPDPALFAAEALVQDYLRLDVPAKLRVDAQSNTEILFRLERYDELATLRRAHLADIEYALAKPEEFSATNPAPMIAQAATLRAALLNMKEVIALCLDPAVAKCAVSDFKEPAAAYTVTLPARLPGETLSTRLAASQAREAALQARITKSTAAIDALLSDEFAVGRNPIARPSNCPAGDGWMGCVSMHQAVRKYCEAAPCKP